MKFRYIIFVVLLVLLFDFLFVLSVFHEIIRLEGVIGLLVVAAILFASNIVLFLSGRKRHYTNLQVEGWALGRGAEISNPEQPISCHVTISDKALDLGILFVGSPGSGKTESCCIGILGHYNQKNPENGWAYFDAKGQRDVYQKAVAVGADPDYFFSSEYPHSHSINLMEGEPFDVGERLVAVLVATSMSTSFYSDEQRAVLLKVVPLLCSLGVPVSLRDLYAALCVEDAAYELLIMGREKGVDPQSLSLAKSWFDLDFNERVKNIAGMLNRLFPFVYGEFSDRLNAYQPDISLSDVVAGNKKIYFHLPYSDFSKDVAVMVVETLAAIAKKRQLEGAYQHNRFPLLFDDWGAMFHPGFKPFSARCRSAAMPLSFAFQSVGQLRDVGPTYQDELDDNIATKVFLRVNGGETGKYVIDYLSTYETRELGTSILGDRSGANIQTTEKSRVSLRELRELDAGEAFVSTLQTNSGEAVNPIYRARFPLPDMSGWQSIDLPLPNTSVRGEGLGLWDRHIGKVNEVSQRLTPSAMYETEEALV